MVGLTVLGSPTTASLKGLNMISSQNLKMPSIIFYHGIDATADLLNASQQYLSTEISERTRDMIKYPGFSWGLRVASAVGQTLTITQGVGIDRFGARLEQSQDASYGIAPPVLGQSSFYLCVRALPSNITYKVHSYDGTRKPTEYVVGLEFFGEASFSTDAYGNVYPVNGNGLVIAKITISGSSYSWDDVTSGTRSPNLKMRDGS